MARHGPSSCGALCTGLRSARTGCGAHGAQKAGQWGRAGTKPEGYYPLVSLSSVWGMALFFAAIGLTLVLAYTGETPFIYAQF